MTIHNVHIDNWKPGGSPDGSAFWNEVWADPERQSITAKIRLTLSYKEYCELLDRAAADQSSFPRPACPQTLAMPDDDEPAELGTVFISDECRAEVRIIGVGRIGFAIQYARAGFEWWMLREVKTNGDVRRLLAALGLGKPFNWTETTIQTATTDQEQQPLTREEIAAACERMKEWRDTRASQPIIIPVPPAS